MRAVAISTSQRLQRRRYAVQVDLESKNSAVEKEFTFTCPQSGSEPSQRWHYLRVYPTNLTTDSKDVIRLQFLSMLLFRGQSSPFYKSLIESQKARLFNPLQG